MVSDAGRQLVLALENSLEFKVSGLDDNKQLQSQILLGKTVCSPNKNRKIIKNKKYNFSFSCVAIC